MMNITLVSQQCKDFYHTIRTHLRPSQIDPLVDDDYPPLSDEELAFIANARFLELDEEETHHG